MISKTFLREDPTIFIACKHSSDSAVKGASLIIKWFQENLPKSQLLTSQKLKFRLPSSVLKSPSNLNFVEDETETHLKDAQLIISCGGDGSLLHISSIFQSAPCPPILPFSMGSLGFLSSFDFSDRKAVLKRLFRDKFTLMNRQRFRVSGAPIPSGKHLILNEVLLNRATINVPEFEFSMNDDDKFFFPSAIADGLILATATGSSGHSLSAGGPILHPTLDCAVLNMLAARTLSFRPLILPIPASNPIKLGMCLGSRAHECDVHLDGINVGKLTKNELIEVSQSNNPVPVLTFFGPTSDWNFRLSTCLKWNQPYVNTGK